MSCSRHRPVFKWNLYKTVPKEESSFGPFQRDLATYLMHRIKEFHVLLMLKAVSKATANCVRSAIHSCGYDHEGYNPLDNWFGHFYNAFNRSMLSFPMQVMYHHEMHTDWYDNNAAFLNKGKRLIVHELAFEVRDRNGVLKTNNDVILWLESISKIMHDSEVEIGQYNDPLFAAREELVCFITRFVIEWPGVGIFHEPAWFIEELGLEDYVREQVLEDRSNDRKPLAKNYYVASGEDIWELLIRLTPYTRIGDSVVGFDHRNGDNHKIPDTASLLYNILLDRVLYS